MKVSPPVKITPRTKEVSDGSCDEDDPLDDGLDEMDSILDIEEPAASDTDWSNKLIHSTLEVLVSHDKKELLDHLKILKTRKKDLVMSSTN